MKCSAVPIPNKKVYEFVAVCGTVCRRPTIKFQAAGTEKRNCNLRKTYLKVILKSSSLKVYFLAKEKVHFQNDNCIILRWKKYS